VKPHIEQALRELEATRVHVDETAHLHPLGDSLADEMICFRLRVLERRRRKREHDRAQRRLGRA
jgi:hypothetical protein